jgi:hypothetical protein
MTTDNEYVDNMFKSWEKTKKEMRKKLPSIYKESNEDIKTIISMLVESEHLNAIHLDNTIRMNANERHEKTTRDVNAKNYVEENKEIFDLLRDS